MIVRSVDLGQGSEDINIGSIGLLEATHGNYGENGGEIFFVSNTRTLQNLTNLNKQWIIGRLK